MSSLRLIIAAMAISLLSGCASSPDVPTMRSLIAQTTPVCVGEADCDAKWKAAQHWVVNYAGLSVHVVTDTLIDTYIGNTQDPRLIVRVTKVPLGADRFQILFFASCNYPYGCIPDKWNATINFNRTIDAIVQ